MIFEKHVPGSIGDGNRFSDKIMRKGISRMIGPIRPKMTDFAWKAVSDRFRLIWR